MMDLFQIDLRFKNIREAYQRGLLTESEVLEMSADLEEQREALENQVA